MIVDKNGIKTIIGSKSGNVTWSSIDSILKENDLIIINGKNGNAFVIPDSTFKNKKMKDTFFKYLLENHKNNQ